MKFDCTLGDRGIVIDRNTGNRIENVVRGDSEAGWFEQYEVDSYGSLIIDSSGFCRFLTKRRQNFLFIRNLDEPLACDSIPF